MSDWEQPMSTRYVDPRTGAIALTSDNAEKALQRVQVSGGLELAPAKKALEEELTKVLQPTWCEVWLSVFQTSVALVQAARAPAGEARVVKLAGAELPMTAPFEIRVTWAGTQRTAVTGELTMTVEFEVPVKVRDGCLCEVAPFTWTATPSIAISGQEVWKGEPREHELGEPYVLKTPLTLV